MSRYYKILIFSRFYLECFLLFTFIATPVILLHYFFTGRNFFTSWNWFHDYVIYFIFCVLTPIAATILTLEILQDRGKITRKIKSRLSKIRLTHHRFIYLLVFASSIFFIGQTFGGCVWQIPNILSGDTDYSWNRFGHAFVPQPLLTLIYFKFFIYTAWIGYHYFHLYLHDHLVKHYKTPIVAYK